MAIIVEKQTFTFYPQEEFGGLCLTVIGSSELIEGESYNVYFDGTNYTCVAEQMILGEISGIGLGNKSIVGIGDDTDEPFIIGYISGFLQCFSTDVGIETTHEMALESVEEDSSVIFEEQTLTFYPDEAFGGLCVGDLGTIELIEGDKYNIVFDDVSYICTAENMVLGNLDGVGVGNKAIVGIGEDTEEPFIIGVVGIYAMCLTAETLEATHKVGIYAYEEPQGIILRNYHAESVVHEGLETVSFEQTDGSIKKFTRGIALADVPISLDFSDGDQTITAEEETLIKSAVIKKPETLTQENIAAGVEIAGIVGIHQGGGGGGSLDDENLKYFMVSFENYGIVTHKPFYDKIYAETGSYDIEVPDELAGLPVYINSNGTGGGFFNSNNVKNITIGENVRYINNTIANVFLNCRNFNSPITIPNGITNMFGAFSNCWNFNQSVTIPNSVTMATNMFSYCNNFNQPITIPNSVTNAQGMFYYCSNFNQPITIPNSVTNAYQMFALCSGFNQPITIPNSVTNTMYMFSQCRTFNQPITIPGSVNDAAYMLSSSPNFNSPVIIENGVNRFSQIFDGCNNFNSQVTVDNSAQSISRLFYRCNSYNQPFTIPNGATTMSETFLNCFNFNRAINIPKNVITVTNAFRNCKNMAQNITVYAKNINNVCGFLYGKNNSKRINIFIPPNCNTNNAFFATSSTNSIVNYTISWTNNTSNQCRYNAGRNIYIYYTVNDEETGA